MVGKVKAAVYPDAVLRHLDIFLRVDRPGALGGNPLSLLSLVPPSAVWGRGCKQTFALCLRCKLDMLVMNYGEQKNTNANVGSSTSLQEPRDSACGRHKPAPQGPGRGAAVSRTFHWLGGLASPDAITIACGRWFLRVGVRAPLV